MKLDLHIHSTASDGTCTPSEVVERAVAGGLDVIALADHDTTAGVGAAMQAAAGLRIHVIPAIELSSTHGGEEVHILGYFINPVAPAIEAHRVRSRAGREDRMRRMLDLLALQGVRLSYEDLKAQLDADDVAPARPHLARALVAAGHAHSVPRAFAELIGNDSPAYLPTQIATPFEVIETILDAGGIPVWAHPETEQLDALLHRLVAAGLAGLEVHRPRNPQAHVDFLEALAKDHNLLVTGGSDWHGPAGKRELGKFFVSGEEVGPFLAAGGL